MSINDGYTLTQAEYGHETISSQPH